MTQITPGLTCPRCKEDCLDYAPKGSTAYAVCPCCDAEFSEKEVGEIEQSEAERASERAFTRYWEG